MNVRELPRKFEGLPVVKATYLGWVGRYSAEPGYFCTVITHGDAGEGKKFHVHLLRALGLDKPWLRIEGDHNLGNGAAHAKFEGYEKLAEWPDVTG